VPKLVCRFSGPCFAIFDRGEGKGSLVPYSSSVGGATRGRQTACAPQSLYAMQATFSTTSISNLHRPHNLRQTPKHTVCWVAVVVLPGRSMVTRPATKPLTSHSCPHLTDGHEPAATGLNGDTNFTEGEGRIKDKNKTVLTSCHCGGKTQPDDK
jgi:hypothetical protein